MNSEEYIEKLEENYQSLIKKYNKSKGKIIEYKFLINDCIKLIESYDLGKYDYSIPIIELEVILNKLKGKKGSA